MIDKDVNNFADNANIDILNGIIILILSPPPPYNRTVKAMFELMELLQDTGGRKHGALLAAIAEVGHSGGHTRRATLGAMSH